MYFSTMHTPNFLFRWQDFPSFHCNCSQWAFFTMLGHNFSLVDKTFHNAHSQHLSFSWQNFLSFRSYCSQGHHTGPLSAPLCSFCRLEGNTWHTSTGSTGCFKYRVVFLTVPPNFLHQNEKRWAANQRFCSMKFLMYKRSPLVEQHFSF